MTDSRFWIPLLIAAADPLPEALHRGPPVPGYELTLPTRIKDADVLRASLREFRAGDDGNALSAEIGGAHVIFRPGAHGRMDAVFVAGVSEERAHSIVLTVEHAYARERNAARHRSSGGPAAD
ncbi:MAG TPA: hypothetical protein VF665_13245 [Longimicrobium sp.]|jgi:hypothetical protein|uniref:hypothetical protein n=1 Tax=Longimicrobium sp. TaxID=2029185 RepID=UPI002ED9CCEA